jgi:hypothetical protein
METGTNIDISGEMGGSNSHPLAGRGKIYPEKDFMQLIS